MEHANSDIVREGSDIPSVSGSAGQATQADQRQACRSAATSKRVGLDSMRALWRHSSCWRSRTISSRATFFVLGKLPAAQFLG